MTCATTLSRVAALCLLAGAAHASPVPAADAGIAVPATVYSPALPPRPAAPEAASPDRAWREQNRIVAGYNPMMLTMGGHGAHAAPSASAPDPHAGHRVHTAHAIEGKAAMPAGGCCTDGCCAKNGADAPPSCAPAHPAPAHHHGGQP